MVSNGISLGHPCCGVRDCKEPLISNWNHYCPIHQDKRGECAIVACGERVEDGFRTCGIPNHRACEERFLEQGWAMFQLKQRFAKVNAVAMEGSDDGAEDDEEDEILMDESGEVVEAAPEAIGMVECTEKPPAGQRRAFARFGRRRTHNEQLCVASCGVILGRATFYGAEGPNSVQVRACFFLHVCVYECDHSCRNSGGNYFLRKKLCWR